MTEINARNAGTIWYVLESFQDDCLVTLTAEQAITLKDRYEALTPAEKDEFWAGTGDADDHRRYDWVNGVLEDTSTTMSPGLSDRLENAVRHVRTEMGEEMAAKLEGALYSMRDDAELIRQHEDDNNEFEPTLTYTGPKAPPPTAQQLRERAQEMAAKTKANKFRHTKHAMGCFQAAGDDEPVFTIRAKDAFFAPVIAFWISMVENGTNFQGMDPEKHDHLADKLLDAKHCIQAGIEWQRNNTHKIPD